MCILDGGISNQLRCLKILQGAPWLQLWWITALLAWAIQWCSCLWVTNVPVSNPRPNKLTYSWKLDSEEVILLLFCYDCIAGESWYVYVSPQVESYNIIAVLNCRTIRTKDELRKTGCLVLTLGIDKRKWGYPCDQSPQSHTQIYLDRN